MAARVDSAQAVDTAILALLEGGEAARANPYPLYAQMREDPVHRSPLGIWFVSTYAGCDWLMRHPAFRRQQAGAWELRAMIQGAAGRHWFEHQSRWMLWLDPPDHGRIRGLVSRAFTPRFIETLRPRVEALVDGLLDRLEAAGEADFIEDFALPLPSTVICDMLGIPGGVHADFRAWMVQAARALQPRPSQEAQDAADAAYEAVEAYFRDMIEMRRRAPGDDLLSALIAAEDGGDRLSHAELVSNAALMMGAGFDTTTNLLGNGLLALLRHPRQWRRLVETPELAANAVEELLRYDTSIQMGVPRVAIEDVDIEGTVLPQGEMVMPVLAAGNRDPRRFGHPDELDISRPDPSPLSFGGGPHFCLGAALARLEGAIAFERLARRLPNLALVDDQPEWLTSQNMHGVESLRIRVGG